MIRLAATLVLAALGLAAEPSLTLHVKVAMRDGVHLCTNVLRPNATGRFPVVLQRTPYRKVSELTPGLKAFIDRGYVVVTQDVRGRYHSAGQFRQFVQEFNDGEDTLNWIARQPWCDGRIGMFGGSYVGLTQWSAALAAHPALKAIAPSVAGGDEYLDRYYSRGGAFRLAHRLRWIAENFKPPQKPVADFQKMATYLPLRRTDRFVAGRTLDFFKSAMDHPAYDAYWRGLSTRAKLDRVRIPVLITAGWYDGFAESDLEVWNTLRAHGVAARILVGPFGHSLSPLMPDADFGPGAAQPLRRLEIEWFDAFVKQSAAPPPSVARYFLQGANEWRESEVWPPVGTTPTALYLTSQHGANSLNGDGRLLWAAPKTESNDRYTYDPRNAVPTLGGATCCNAKVLPWGPLDQRRVEGRTDVLVYSTEPLKSEVEIAGPVRVVLHVASSAPDTDFTAKLVDVFPDGRARILCDGILRLRYRTGLDRAAPYSPGSVERIEISAGVTANLFKAGHRIRIEIASSNFPKYDRNLNTGRAQSDEREIRAARQQIFSGPQTPSQLVLPVVAARR